MIFGQSMMVLGVIMDNPGLNRLGIASHIKKKYGKKRDAVRFMFLKDTSDESHLVSIIKNLYCVEEKEGKYYFVEYLPVKNEKDLVQTTIRNVLEGMDARGLLDKYRKK